MWGLGTGSGFLLWAALWAGPGAGRPGGLCAAWLAGRPFWALCGGPGLGAAPWLPIMRCGNRAAISAGCPCLAACSHHSISVQVQSRAQMLPVLSCLYLPLPAHHRQGHQLNSAAAKASDAFDESLTGGFASEWGCGGGQQGDQSAVPDLCWLPRLDGLVGPGGGLQGPGTRGHAAGRQHPGR